MADFFIGLSGYLNDLGASVVLPILITIFGLILGLPFKKAFKAGVTIGIGFIGINLVIGLMGQQVSPAAQAMAERFGVGLDVVDVGWPSSAAIAFGSTIGAAIIPLALALNMILLFTGLTRTFNIDLWNFWHSAMILSLIHI